MPAAIRTDAGSRGPYWRSATWSAERTIRRCSTTTAISSAGSGRQSRSAFAVRRISETVSVISLPSAAARAGAGA